MFLGYQVKKWW